MGQDRSGQDGGKIGLTIAAGALLHGIGASVSGLLVGIRTGVPVRVIFSVTASLVILV